MSEFIFPYVEETNFLKNLRLEVREFVKNIYYEINEMTQDDHFESCISSAEILS